MKRQFQDKYDRVDTFTDSNPIRSVKKIGNTENLPKVLFWVSILNSLFRCLRRLTNDPEGASIGSSSSLRNQNSEASGQLSISKRTRPVSWMESSNTLASVSNYGGSECSLADRGRRRYCVVSSLIIRLNALFNLIEILFQPFSTRRSKPKEWFQSLLGSTTKLNKENREVILKEQVTPSRPRRPPSIPRRYVLKSEKKSREKI